MARGLNKVMLIGNVGRDPEIRHTAAGVPCCNLSIATTETWRDKATGEKKESTEWHKLALFGKIAEIAGEYVKKGRTVYVEGRLQTRKYQDKDGRDQYSTEIIVSDLHMIGHDADYVPQRAAVGIEARKAPEPAGEFDDDIPF